MSQDIVTSPAQLQLCSWHKIPTVPTYRVVVTPAHTPVEQDTIAHRVYFLDGSALTCSDAARIAQTMLADPVTESYAVDPPPPAQAFVDVTFLPGVTDSVAESLLHAARHAGFPALERAASGVRITHRAALDARALDALARDRYANEVIQRYAVNTPIDAPFVETPGAWRMQVDHVMLRGAADDALLAISRARRLSLDLNEMRAIRDYYIEEQREPTDVELETLAQTWSEHCVHKTFKALIDLPPGAGARQVNGLLRTYIRAATEKLNKPWVKSAFVDNAGVIAFEDGWDLAFKVETHNHPSALEPFGGANTGVGGVIRDVLGVSARPIANTDVLCFGPLDRPNTPAGVLPPQRIYDGVIRGIEDYGNKMGIPTVNGAIYFHEGYTANPLVFCGCLGLLPSDLFARPRPARNVGKGVQAGDLIVVIGGRTGRDGLRGATFSSMEMDTGTSQIAGSSVQIGHPIHEKAVQEALLLARDADLYHAVTDCGAGGFSSAVGEMAAGVGARVQLKDAPLKYPGLQPWEIWLSEAQERMVMAVPPSNWGALKAICDGQDAEAFVLGVFEPSGRLTLHYGDQVVGDLSIRFLHDGIPQRRLAAHPAEHTVAVNPQQSVINTQSSTYTAALLRLLAHPNIRSKEDVVRMYDHEVKGGGAVKPFVGVANHGPSDAAVLAPLPGVSNKGVALSNGLCPLIGERDPYAMAWAAIDEAVRNAVAVGADPDQIAILDNFCWGNPNLPDRLHSLAECARGCHDAALAYGVPFISGKDSLNNEYADAEGKRHAIPGTLLISALGIVPDIARTVTMDFKAAGNAVYALGVTRAELGASHYAPESSQPPPAPVPDAIAALRLLHRAMHQDLVRACHDCSEGGLAVALAEMCLAGRVGAMIEIAPLPVQGDVDDEARLFSESSARFVIEVMPKYVDEFEALLAGLPLARIGTVGGDRLRVSNGAGRALIDAEVDALERAWRGRTAPYHAPATARRDDASGYRRRAPTGKRVLILHANGTNRDHDAALAVTLAGGAPEIVHVNRLLAGECVMRDYHMLILPGGFSYGDDLGAGVLWSLELRLRLGDQLRNFVESGRPVLGICNGFQTLVKAGVLPDLRLDDPSMRPATLTYNARGRFECRWVWLEANPASPSIFTRGLHAPIYCPVAHGEGNFQPRDDTALRAIESANLVPLRYAGEGYPFNPNGSAANIAALCNPAGNVLGLMPHPENHIFPWQHPRRHRGERGGDGLRLFVNGLAAS